MAQILKKEVGFNIDLRKTDKNPSIKKGNDSFNFGERMAILRAFREKRKYMNQTFVPITRNAGESKSAYEKRLTQTKKDFGQSGLHYPGIYTNTPDYVKIKKKRVKNKDGKYTTEISNTMINKQGAKRVEIVVPIGNGLDFAQNPEGILDDLRERYKGKYNFIQCNHSGYRGSGGKLDWNEDDKYERFKRQLIKWANKYAPISKHRKNEAWLSGFYLSDFIVQVDMTPKRKKARKPKVNKKGRNV